MTQDELPQQMLARVMYVANLLAEAEAQESTDKKAHNKLVKGRGSTTDHSEKQKDKRQR